MTAFLFVLGLVALAVMTFAFAWRFLGAPMRQYRRELRAAPTIPEIPPLDPMVICPVCGLMGEHPIEEVPPRDAQWFADGSSRRSTPGHFVRRCVFYPDQHVWGVPASAREETP